MPDPDRKPPCSYHCPSCLKGKGPAGRARMHCGFVPREQWPPGRGSVPDEISGAPYTSDICPGWTARQDEVEEAAELYAASEADVLDRLDPLHLQVVTRVVMLAKRAFNLHHAARMQRIADEARRRR